MIALLVLLACKTTPTPAETAECDAPIPGQGVDPAVIASCGACHTGVAAGYTGSHALLLDCRGCHGISDRTGGAGHATRPSCDACHSEVSHVGLRCTTCHDPHGTGNLALIRSTITTTDGTSSTMRFTAALGLATDGLVHGDGTGLCETCHAGTAHYDATGSATPHETRWCGACHAHTRGFQAP